MGYRIHRRGALCAALLGLFAGALHAQVNVLTFHNDNARTGQNLQETVLTPANVNSTQFGKLYSVTVDGTVYAQPLYLSNVTIAGGAHNVVYVATEHDSVYAMDADSGRIYWQKSLIPAGGSTVASDTDLFCGDIKTEVGITGTPVIDPTTGTLYVVTKVKLNGVISQYLHAMDVSTGAEKLGGPVAIKGSVPGTATDGDGTMVSFDTRREFNRTGLLLENGHVIVAFAGHCDKAPWHGWVMSYNASTLTQEAVYNDSPKGYGNGIWMSGAGLATDGKGNIYSASGNGSWNGTTDLGDSVIKLGPPSNNTFPVLDYFTPYNQGSLASTDNDLSAGSVLILPTTSTGKEYLVILGKEGKIYLLDRNNLGKYCIAQNPACSNSNPQIVQEIGNAFTALWNVPAYWNGNIYWSGGNGNTGGSEPMKAFSFNANNSGLISTAPTSVTAKAFNFTGPVPSISANGNSNAILWGMDNGRVRAAAPCTDRSTCQVLYAYDATNLAKVLYTSLDGANERDRPIGGAVKWTTPTIANGKVFVPSNGAVNVYGLLNAATPVATAPSLSPAAGSYAAPQSVTLGDTTPNAVIYYTVDGSNPTTASARYATAISVATTTTIKAFAAASGYANSAVTTAVYTISTATGGNATPVNLSPAFNVNGIAQNGTAVSNGGLDTFGYAYSSALLGNSLSVAGTTFNFAAAGSAGALSGGTITLAGGSYTTLDLLGAATHGNALNQVFTVTYTDGTSTSFTQSLSDWFTPQNYTGETTAKTMAYRVKPDGSLDNRTFYLYRYALALNGAKTVKSVTLPNNRGVVILAATLSAPTTTPATPGVATPVSLASVANINGIVSDGAAVINGGIDTFGFAYSKNLLGTTLAWSNTSFTLGAAGAANVVSGKVIALTAGKYASLKLLASAIHNNQPAQVFTVTYTDGTKTQVTQSLSDWFTPQNYAGESQAATHAYRLKPDGSKDERTFYVYGYSLPLDGSKVVQSLTLPNNRSVVVLAATLVPPAAGGVSASLSAVANINGVFSEGKTVTNGGLDTHDTAYSSALLGTTVNAGGVAYSLLGPNVLDAAWGVTVPLAAGSYSTINLLGSAVNGSQAAQSFVVTYTDGSTTTVKQGVSDWFVPQGYAGETKAVTMPYRLNAAGAMATGPCYLYAYSLAVNNAKTVKSITLPANRRVVILAVTARP